MNNFCTLFDSNYLSRGLVMYRSLLSTGTDFHLYVYAFDDLCADILVSMNLPRITVVSLTEFEDERLLAIKPSRSRVEYCWTCTSHAIGHAMKTFGLMEITYLDADLYFYSDPAALLDEFHDSGSSVLLTEHRYTFIYDQSKKSGIYCVQFITFRNDIRGLSALCWWQDRCLEWCYAIKENGKFGDQKYLDDWLERFTGIHVLTHIGGGVAPWNIQKYSLHKEGIRLLINGVPLVFYHFHGYKFYKDGTQNLGDYWLKTSVIDLLYRPYVHAVQSAQREISELFHNFNHGNSLWDTSFSAVFGRFKRKLKGEYNVYNEL